MCGFPPTILSKPIAPESKKTQDTTAQTVQNASKSETTQKLMKSVSFPNDVTQTNYNYRASNSLTTETVQEIKGKGVC